MKTKNILFGIIFFGSILLFISLVGGQTNLGPHGGRVQEVDEFNIETKITNEFVYAYILDRKSRPMSNRGVKCEIRFVFIDKPYKDFVLLPYDEDGFKLRANTTGYHLLYIHFQLFGKTISTTFDNENENLIAHKK